LIASLFWAKNLSKRHEIPLTPKKKKLNLSEKESRLGAKRARYGYIKRPERGLYKITQKGKKFLKVLPQ